MKVLSIGTDRTIFKEGSPARLRMIEYGALFDELHIIIFSKRVLGHIEQKIGDNVWIYPTNSLSKFFYMRDAQKIAQKIVAQRAFDARTTVITAQDPFETGNVAYKLKKKYSFPLQIQVHTDLFSKFFIMHSLLNSIRVQMARKILPAADGIRVVSERIKHSLQKELTLLDEKIDVLPIYSPHSSIQEPQRNIPKKYPEYSTVILMVGRLVSEKNIGFALEVFKEVVALHPSTGLVIIGEGPEKKSLQRTVKKLHLTSSVVFETWQNNLLEYYKNADMFLHTSLYEGYGLVLVEAVQAGVPIVTSNVGIAGSMLIDNESAYVCPVNNLTCFKNALIRLIEDISLRETFVKAAKESILKNTPQSHQEYMHQYKILIEKLKTSHTI